MLYIVVGLFVLMMILSLKERIAKLKNPVGEFERDDDGVVNHAEDLSVPYEDVDKEEKIDTSIHDRIC